MQRLPSAKARDLDFLLGPVGSRGRSSRRDGIKQVGVWGNLHLSSIWDTLEGKGNFRQDALPVSKRSGRGPREVAEGVRKQAQERAEGSRLGREASAWRPSRRTQEESDADRAHGGVTHTAVRAGDGQCCSLSGVREAYPLGHRAQVPNPRVVSGTLIGLQVCVLLCPEGFETVSYLTECVAYSFPHK